MIRATLGEAVPLQLQLSTGEGGLFPRVKVYNSSGSIVLTAGLAHIGDGLYGTSNVFNTEGFYTAVYQVFSDPAFTSAADFDVEAETIEANSDKLNILRLLGLTHDNVYIDQNQYDIKNNLIGSRIRQYDSKANADLHGTAGLLNTWVVEASYDSENRLSTYKVTRG